MWLTDKKLVWILCALLGLTTILDLYTAYSSPIFKIAETNPLFLNYGVYTLTAINFIWMFVIIRGLKKSLKLMTLFAFVMATLFLSYGHLIGMNANITATNAYLKDPYKILEQIKSYTPEQKSASYNDLVLNRIFYPYIICITGFSIIFYLYNSRRPKREQLINEGYKLLRKGMEEY